MAPRTPPFFSLKVKVFFFGRRTKGDGRKTIFFSSSSSGEGGRIRGPLLFITVRFQQVAETEGSLQSNLHLFVQFVFPFLLVGVRAGPLLMRKEGGFFFYLVIFVSKLDRLGLFPSVSFD